MMNLGDMEGMDLEASAHPQPLFKGLREAGAVVDMIEDLNMVIVGNAEDIREVLMHPDVYSSGVDAVQIGQVRPLIPLQIDPPRHKYFRRLLDPIFGRETVAELEPRTRELVKELIDAVKDNGGCNFHESLAEPLPSTVFLQLMGLPVERTKEFIELKDGIVRPAASTNEERIAMTDATGQKIYAVLKEAIAERDKDRKEDLISMLLDASVDGEQLTHDQVEDILYLMFLAGLDTVTASLDCMISYLAQHPDHRKQLVEDPSLIHHAIEEMLRWETPVTGVIRITSQDTELGGCPIPAHTQVSVILGSSNTDEKQWERADEVDFHRDTKGHLAFGGGNHRCLGAHLARMELRVALEEWLAAVPDFAIKDGVELRYSQGLRSIDNLELVW
ncbi:MAG: hypothetical protein QOI61_866 [Actinomycetota bacterium]